MSFEYSLMAAHSLNRVIGKDGRIPWYSPSDLRQFRLRTRGRTVVMGRKTWDSLGRMAPLEDRFNVVVSRSQTNEHGYERTEFVPDIEKALVHPNTVVIGGQGLYEFAVNDPRCKLAWITVIDIECEGDAFFPEFPDHWRRVQKQSVTTEENGLRFWTEIWQNYIGDERLTWLENVG